MLYWGIVGLGVLALVAACSSIIQTNASAGGRGAPSDGQAASADPGRIDATRAAAAIAQGAVVLDVRTPAEFAGSKVKRSVNISHTEVAARVSEVDAMVGGDKNKTIVLYCRSGRRSGLSSRELAKLGYTVINGGGLKGLQKEIAKP